MYEESLELLDRSTARLEVYESNHVPFEDDYNREDYVVNRMTFDKLLLLQAGHTAVVRVQGREMEDMGFQNKDILILNLKDREVEGKIVVALRNGSLIARRLERKDTTTVLVSDDPETLPIEVDPSDELMVWGSVTHTVRECR